MRVDLALVSELTFREEIWWRRTSSLQIISTIAYRIFT